MENVRYVIFGTGAIGSVIGAWLMRAGSSVELIARPAFVDAIQNGITIRQGENETVLRGKAHMSIRDIEPDANDIVFITTKSQSTDDVSRELRDVYGASVPVVCLQNGTRNEEIASRHLEKVYAGLLFISAVQVRPDLITLPQGRGLAFGRYPGSVDSVSERIAADLTNAGFDAISSAHVMSMKWGKLIANLNNASLAITGYWVEKAVADARMRQLVLAVREEGFKVLDAAGIAVEPPPGEPAPFRIRAWTERMRTAPYDSAALDLPEDQRTYASTLQDLFLGRKTSEADYLNGEIVQIGSRLGIPTPYNSTLLAVVNRMFDEGLKPGLYSPRELDELVNSSA